MPNHASLCGAREAGEAECLSTGTQPRGLHTCSADCSNHPIRFTAEHGQHPQKEDQRTHDKRKHLSSWAFGGIFYRLSVKFLLQVLLVGEIQMTPSACRGCHTLLRASDDPESLWFSSERRGRVQVQQMKDKQAYAYFIQHP